jgi:hypothetical protein
MKQTQYWRAFGLMAGVLVLGGRLLAQTTSSGLPPVGILASDPTALWGTSSAAFTVIRYGPTTNDLAVDLAISGTASNGVDYVQLTNVAVIPSGYMALDILVQPIPPTVNTGNKTVVLEVLTNADYQVLPGARWAKVTIVDDVYNIPSPSVAITTPTNGSTFWAGTPITVTADATDTGAAIASVSFYANDLFLGSATSSPFSVVWTNPPPRRYALFARAENTVGESTLSAPVQITVSNPVPVVTWLSPTNGSNFTAHDNIPLQVNATDPLNAIVKVNFYANGRTLGVATNSPYTFTWTNVPAGLYFLQASATDAANYKGWSQRVLISVSR